MAVAAAAVGLALVAAAVGGSGLVRADSPLAGTFVVLALFMSALSAVVALVSMAQARRAETELRNVARSVDLALRSLSERSDRTVSTIGSLADAVERELGDVIERLGPAGPGRAEARGVTAPPVPPPGADEPEEPAPDAARLDRFELSLQPIIDVAGNAAAGFDVFANLRLADGGERAVRRLKGDIDVEDRIRFETAMFEAAVETARRQLGPRSADLPLHVALSVATLDDAPAVTSIIDRLDIQPGLARGLVVTLPSGCFDGETARWHPSVQRLTAAGARVACEGWPDGADPARALAGGGVGFLRLASSRLLDLDRPRRRAAPGADIAGSAQAAGLAVVATGVATDEQAVGLIDLGVTLMSGDRFSGPRRLRSEGTAEAPGRADG